jgi:hypothetical protein
MREQRLMSAVDAIEITDGDNPAPEVFGKVVAEPKPELIAFNIA